MITPSIKAVAFDLDGTLAVSKMPITSNISSLLSKLLLSKKVLVMSGGGREQIEKQLVSRLPSGAKLENLYMMPTSGAEFLFWDKEQKKWTEKYSHRLTDEEAARIISILSDAVSRFLSEDISKNFRLYGEQIENRGTQITFSALGQAAPAEEKAKWDPDDSKRKKVVEDIKDKLPEFSVRIGGSTSIDITRKGIDKAFGVVKFMNHLHLAASEVIFFGDALFKGGNDSPVERTGVKSISVKGPDDTAKHIHRIIYPQTRN